MTLPTAHLRIAATSDLHMNLTGWDALRDVPTKTKGMDRLATLIKSERQNAPGGFVLVDNGDSLQGTPLGDICVNASDNHPWPAILNALRYDAAGLGNHDFDFGLPFLEQVMAQADCAVLCANITQGAVSCAAPFTVIERFLVCADGQKRRLRVGLTSVLPPQTAVWNRRCLDGVVQFEDGVQATQKAVAALRSAGADLVVLLCHSGLSDGADPVGENFGATIAAEVPGIDAMVLGHTHLRFPGPDHAGFEGVDAVTGTLYGVPAVMPGHAGTEVGIIDLQLRYGADGWEVSTHNVRRAGIPADLCRDSAVVDLVHPVAEATRAHLNRPIANANEHMHTWFSMLLPSSAEELVARALCDTVATAIAGTDLASLPVLASVAPAALGGRAGPDNYVNIPPGPFLERHVSMLCPYPNTVWAAVLTGAELRDWIDRSLAFFTSDRDGGAILVNSDAPAFNFDMVHGLQAEVDLSAAAAFDITGHRVTTEATRIHRLTHGSREVQPCERFVLAMTSYRGAGGGNFPGLGAQAIAVRTDVELRDAVRQTIAGDGIPSLRNSAPTWTFVPSSRSRRVIRTSPAAEAHLAYISKFNPRPLGLDESGFLQVQVTV